MKYITIIGSRDISTKEKNILKDIAYQYAAKGYTIRSGGADGSDSVINPFYQVQIIIPWNGFNKLHHDGKRVFCLDNLPLQEKAKEKAMSIHPAPYKLSKGAIKLHTRNIYQIIGPNADIKSELVIYCADETDGEPLGGTRTAILYAKELNIPTINIRILNKIK